jgi:hypothetical protein
MMSRSCWYASLSAFGVSDALSAWWTRRALTCSPVLRNSYCEGRMNTIRFRWSSPWTWRVTLKRILLLAFTFFVLTTACSSQLGSPAAGTSWTIFQDPAEHSFQIAVPQGWKITGGLYRFAPLDPRMMVDMVSPDGRTDIRLGDYRVPRFATLTPILRGLGFHEGSSYNRQAIGNYRPGWVFADVYGQGRYSGLCSELRLKSMQKQRQFIPTRALPPLPQAM